MKATSVCRTELGITCAAGMVSAEHDKRFSSANRPVCRTDLGITYPARRVGAEPLGDESWKLEIATVTRFSYRTRTGSTIRVFIKESKADFSAWRRIHIFTKKTAHGGGRGKPAQKILALDK